jgi:hypothetical protein
MLHGRENPVPGEWPEQRVAPFVDIQNRYYGARDSFERHVD